MSVTSDLVCDADLNASFQAAHSQVRGRREPRLSLVL